jgi:DNA repair protein RecO (recombination protein O)
MRFLLRRFYVAFTIMAASTLMFALEASARYDPSWEWYTIQADEFTIYYPKGHELFAQRVLSLCNEAIREEEPNEPLFSLLYHSLSFLAYGDSDARDILIYFLIRYLDALGFRPSVTACARCGADLRNEKLLAFSPEAGGALCPSCSAGAAPVSALSLEAMRRILLLRDSEMNKARLPEKVREEL